MSKRNGWELVRALPLPVVFKVNGAVGAGVEHKSMSEEVFPLYFLHIAKTGGTSLTAALKAFYRADEVISDAGNISVDFLKAHEHRINDATFLHGHAQHDVMLIGLTPKATTDSMRGRKEMPHAGRVRPGRFALPPFPA